MDVEDYFQVEAFAGQVARASWDQWPSRVVENTQRVLDLFDLHQAKGTFFFVGWVAARFPKLVSGLGSAWKTKKLKAAIYQAKTPKVSGLQSGSDCLAGGIF